MADLHAISSPASSDRRLDVVFVHGLGGDPFNTWRYGDDQNNSWPHWLAAEYGSAIGVWSLGYAASPTQWQGLKRPFLRRSDPEMGATMALPLRARNALERLALEGIGQRPVCFITHSLGGLLVKSILRRAVDSPDAPEWRRVAEQCRGVLFLATPHHGSGLADLASAFKPYLPTVTIDDLKDNDVHLMELYEWYRSYAQDRIHTRSYFENKKTKGVVIVVPQSSADPGVSGPLARAPIPVDRDHLEICKPRDQRDLVYLRSKELIDLTLREAAPEPQTGTNVLVRSFPARVNENETLIDLTDLFLCATPDDRRPKHPEGWSCELPQRLAEAVDIIANQPQPVVLGLRTHLSIAWYLGTRWNPKGRPPILLRQQSAASIDEIWDASKPTLPPSASDWSFDEPIVQGEGSDLALVVTVTHNVMTDAQRAIDALDLSISEVHHAQLAVSNSSIQDGGHARWLANKLITTLREEVIRLQPARVHLFAACPVSFAFLLGQQADALGPTTVYEFAFGDSTRQYTPGMATGR